MIDFRKEVMASARVCARSYGIKDKTDIEIMARQFEADLRRHDELKALAQ